MKYLVNILISGLLALPCAVAAPIPIYGAHIYQERSCGGAPALVQADGGCYDLLSLNVNSVKSIQIDRAASCTAYTSPSCDSAPMALSGEKCMDYPSAAAIRCVLK
ncbi:hypothetical protein H113_01623 [Trichophyton rubrum MR1459]|uniref:Uncharacterized protein n=1 Tax=Trichophyton rubrum (strain ATCC MYA-4607 / CBS 118892) TaxID=559305 RepID=F2SXG0_TRIRC|nr:uncharacterized protein TERG_07255 [Trichophyton rubrum CBS 118892]EGD91032.1 hypothetical protein TERG_07255 [Trichophyton rubrum CBS 118892]EZF98595.1 hypothetical protein H113_01623 [Trichophyton rubrum MR1459]EZG09715.1 hypothetical protein H106_01390 [Trichophyton rubrum CBS 735.88]KMQ46009.1 hypothetical protein HL42_3255 [Trichophyton rubrum]